MREMKYSYKILIGNSEGKDHFEDRGLDAKTLLIWALKRWGGRV
jgi:hypothetical protein